MKHLIIIILLFSFTCSGTIRASGILSSAQGPLPGAYRMNEYLHFLQGKKVGVVANHTSLVAGTLLPDTLLSRGIRITVIFSPEHGYKGNAADGTLISDGTDGKTGTRVVSLYGDHRKPSANDLKGIDIVVFDLQDVGCRFYTYISTLSLVMEACAENKVPLLVLDRPNPNGSYIDGPVLEKEFTSFVGMHPVPVVYGMTIGEYAQMVNGEKWLAKGVECNLRVIPCRKYSHSSRYILPVGPSPNLQGMNAVYLYPSLCFFEGTVVSVGRGTDKPFECVGHPSCLIGSYQFIPKSIPGVSDHPPLEGQRCFGMYLGNEAGKIMQSGKLNLDWLLGMYASLNLGDAFFTPNFEKLAGTASLRKQIESGMTAESIRESWQPGISQFRKIRNKYLLYPDNQ